MLMNSNDVDIIFLGNLYEIINFILVNPEFALWASCDHMMRGTSSNPRVDSDKYFLSS